VDAPSPAAFPKSCSSRRSALPVPLTTSHRQDRDGDLAGARAESSRSAPGLTDSPDREPIFHRASGVGMAFRRASEPGVARRCGGAGRGLVVGLVPHRHDDRCRCDREPADASRAATTRSAPGSAPGSRTLGVVDD
jgi:hypothetical protein